MDHISQHNNKDSNKHSMKIIKLMIKWFKLIWKSQREKLFIIINDYIKILIFHHNLSVLYKEILYIQ